MREIKQYLNLEKGYDVNFVDFLISASKAIIETYCNNIIFQKQVETDIEVISGRGLLPYSYVSEIHSVKVDDVEVEFEHIKRNQLHYVISYHNGFATVNLTAGFETIPEDIKLVLAELVKVNYDNARSGNLGIDSKTVSIGAENVVTRFLDLSDKHKSLLNRYKRISI